MVSVEKYSAAYTAGLKPGDVLHAWSRADATGGLSSPFELRKIEIEQGPLGRVVIDGVRSSETVNWSLGEEDWGIETRPEFPRADLQAYLRARSLVENGDIKRAILIWHSIASRNPGDPWMYSWCAADAAAFVAKQKRWKEVDLLYKETNTHLGEASAADVVVLREWLPALEETGRWDKVFSVAHQALARSESLDPEGLLTATVLNECALIADWRRDIKTAKELYQRSLVIHNKLAPQSLATARTLLGFTAAAINGEDLASAEEMLSKAKPLLESTSPNGPESVQFKLAQSAILAKHGNFSEARELLMGAREVLQTRWPDSLDLAKTLGSLAFIAARQGDLNNAELLLEQAFTVYRKHPIDPALLVHLSNDSAVIAFQRRDFASAEKYGIEVEKTAASLMPDSIDHAGALMNLGLYTFNEDKLKASETYWIRASEIIQRVAPTSIEHARILQGISDVDRELGDLKNAEAYALRAKEILDKTDPGGIDTADVMEALADTAQAQGDLRRAEGLAERALALRGKFTPSSVNYADSLAQLAGIQQAKGEVELAISSYDKFVKTVEGDAATLGGSEESRIGFRAFHGTYYRKFLDLLVEQGQDEKAFEMAERLRSRTLLELLSDSDIDLRQHLDPSLSAQEDALRKEFATDSDRRLRLITGTHSREELESADAKLNDVLHRFADLEARIHDASPAYAHATQPEIVSVREVQSKLLDPQTLLLEYSLGEKQSYLWLVSSDTVTTYPLPGREEIEKAARGVYDLMSRHASVESHPSSATEATHSHGSAIDTLSKMLLGPVEGKLGSKRLLIVADEVLNYVPFSALTVTDSATGMKLPLITEHEVVNLPSASVLAAIRQEHAQRPSPPRAVAVLADPVFDVHDPRVQHRDAAPVEPSKDHEERLNSFAATRAIDLTRRRWATALGLDGKYAVHFPRLTYSRQEAREIMAATPSGEGLEALDFKASRALAMKPELAKYKILHFATHGLIDTKHPGFSGLLFSLVNERGEPEIGLLSLSDIYGLNLPVDMVVLSGCKTALGKEAKGEGLVGLTRGFLYAGASRVVSSLWEVNDPATAALMGRFYREMERHHLPAAAALRKAQLEMQKGRRWSDPYYWAGFQLQGDWQ